MGLYLAVIDNMMTAYHKKKFVVDEYLTNYTRSHPNSTCLLAKKVSKKKGVFLSDSENELVEVEDGIYVPRKYEDAYFFAYSGVDWEYENIINQLESLIVKENRKNRKKKLLKALKFVSEQKSDPYTPSVQELVRAQNDLMEWNHQYYWKE